MKKIDKKAAGHTLRSAHQIGRALVALRLDQARVFQGMAAERGLDPQTLTTSDFECLLLGEASWDDLDPDSDHTYGRDLRAIAACEASS